MFKIVFPISILYTVFKLCEILCKLDNFFKTFKYCHIFSFWTFWQLYVSSRCSFALPNECPMIDFLCSPLRSTLPPSPDLHFPVGQSAANPKSLPASLWQRASVEQMASVCRTAIRVSGERGKRKWVRFGRGGGCCMVHRSGNMKLS